MIKKSIILIVFSIILCGCDANYNAQIGIDGVKENLSLKSVGVESYQKKDLKDFLQSFVDANIPMYFNPDEYDDMNGDKQDGVSYYNIVNNEVGIDVDGVFSLSDIYRSRVIKACYNEVNIQKNANTYRINTNNKCNAFDDYPLLKNLTIDLELLYDVIHSNADIVNGNHYIWKLNENNYENKNISIVFSTDSLKIDAKDSKKEDKSEDKEKYNWANEHPILLVLITFTSFFLILVIVFVLYNKFR